MVVLKGLLGLSGVAAAPVGFPLHLQIMVYQATLQQRAEQPQLTRAALSEAGVNPARLRPLPPWPLLGLQSHEGRCSAFS